MKIKCEVKEAATDNCLSRIVWDNSHSFCVKRKSKGHLHSSLCFKERELFSQNSLIAFPNMTIISDITKMKEQQGEKNGFVLVVLGSIPHLPKKAVMTA